MSSKGFTYPKATATAVADGQDDDCSLLGPAPIGVVLITLRDARRAEDQAGKHGTGFEVEHRLPRPSGRSLQTVSPWLTSHVALL
jgi:hypothetical protein